MTSNTTKFCTLQNFTTTKKPTKKTKTVSFGKVSYYIVDNNNEHRVGTWVQDRIRFAKRCEDVNKSISYCFQTQHRLKVLQSTIFTIYNNPLEQNTLQPCLSLLYTNQESYN